MDAVLTLGFRGEDVIYRLGDREAVIGFTYGSGPQLVPWTLKKWSDGQPMSEQEKMTALDAAIRFIRSDRAKPSMLINRDDADRVLWEEVARNRSADLGGIEYTSDAQLLEESRQMTLRMMGNGDVVMNDQVAHNEAELNALWPSRLDELKGEMIVRAPFEKRLRYYQKRAQRLDLQLRLLGLLGLTPRGARQDAIELIRSIEDDRRHDTAKQAEKLNDLLAKYPRIFGAANR